MQRQAKARLQPGIERQATGQQGHDAGGDTGQRQHAALERQQRQHLPRTRAHGAQHREFAAALVQPRENH
ncbi:hypothetical protein D3C86_1756450 [compost metagenome]